MNLENSYSSPYIRSFSSSNKYNTLIRFKAIHLYKELVQGLLTLIMTAAKACTAQSPDCINLINENYTRRLFLTLIKQVPYTRCPDTYKHFNKIRTAYTEKRDISLTCYCLGKEGLTCTRRAHNQYTLWY